KAKLLSDEASAYRKKLVRRPQWTTRSRLRRRRPRARVRQERVCAPSHYVARTSERDHLDSPTGATRRTRARGGVERSWKNAGEAGDRWRLGTSPPSFGSTVRRGIHSSQRGRYHFQSPSSFIAAGSSTPRIRSQNGGHQRELPTN